MKAARALDGQGLHAVLMRAVVHLRADQFVTLVCLPLLHRVGELWEAEQLRPMEEHVVSVAVRRVLSWLMDQVPPGPGAPVIVLTTLQGEQHELGAMLGAVLAAVEGWRPVYLGPDLPPEEIVAAVARSSAAAVGISMVVVGGESAARQLAALREALGREVDVIVGGAASATVESGGATRLADLGSYRAMLRTRRGRHAAGGGVAS